jgi:hypothetical protein
MSREDEEKYINDAFIQEAAKFFQGPVWADVKRTMMARMPSWPDPADEVHVAAARGFEVKSYIRVLEEISRLPFDRPESNQSFIPKALLDQRD